MTDRYFEQIVANLNQKDTDELLSMWITNDHFEWSDITFKALKQILLTRMNNLPPQNQPIFDHPRKDEKNEMELSAVFYNPNNVLKLDKWLNRAAVVAIIATAISNFLNFSRVRDIIWWFLGASIEIKGLVTIIAFIAVLFLIALQSILYYFLLRGLGKILKILMEMEFNSRSVLDDHE